MAEYFPTNEQDQVTKGILDSLNKAGHKETHSKFLPYEDDYLGHVSPFTDFVYYKKLPKVYRDFDEPLGKPLYKYLQSLIEGGYAEVVSSSVEGENGVDSLLNLIDPQTCPDEFLPYYCKSMGIDWYPDLAVEGGEAFFVATNGEAFYTDDDIPFGVINKGRGTYYIRTFLSNVGEIYKRRGTESVVKYIAKVLTEMDVSLSYQRFIESGGITSARILWVELQANTPEEIKAVEVNAKIIKRFIDTQIPYYITSVVTYVLKKNIECDTYLGAVVSNNKKSDIRIAEYIATNEGDYIWEVINDEAYIIYYIGNIPNPSVPSTLDGHTVVALYTTAFNGRSDITAVELPSSVRIIE